MKKGKSGEIELSEDTFKVTVKVYWEEYYDDSTNKSIIKITKLTGTSPSYFGTYYLDGSISVDNTNIITFNALSEQHYLYWGAKNEVGNVRIQKGGTSLPWESVEIEHDGNGDKTVNLVVNLTGKPDGSNSWTVSGSESIELTHIDWNKAYINEPDFGMFTPHIYNGVEWEVLPTFVFNGTIWEQYGGGDTAEPSYDPVFANNTWEQIADACRTRRVPDTWLVGDQKTMTIGGTDYSIDIIGKDHDDYSDGSGKAPLTFQLNTYSLSGSMNSLDTNQGGWESSNIRLNSMSSILGKMPSGVKDTIREVIKPTSSGNKNGQLIHSVDKLFLLSEIEIFGTTDNSFVGEGTQYEYYKDESNRIKSYNGPTLSWWQRSPDKNTANKFCRTLTSGASSTEFSSSFSQIIPAFCF